MSRLMVYSPVPSESDRRVALNSRLPSLEGAKLGLLGNWKPNAAVLLEEVGRLLGRYGVAEVILREKHSPSVPASVFMLDEIAERCDIALTAMGDCGSCTSWCIHDAVELERRGIPSLSFVAKPFMVLAEYELESLGCPYLPTAVVRYPFGGLPLEEAQAEATRVLDQVIAGLTVDPVASGAGAGQRVGAS